MPPVCRANRCQAHARPLEGAEISWAVGHGRRCRGAPRNLPEPFTLQSLTGRRIAPVVTNDAAISSSPLPWLSRQAKAGPVKPAFGRLVVRISAESVQPRIRPLHERPTDSLVQGSISNA